MRVTATSLAALFLTACGPALVLESDQREYSLSPVDGVTVYPILSYGGDGEAEYAPCNIGVGMSQLGDSRLERFSDGVWGAIGTLAQQSPQWCSVKLGCALGRGGRSRPLGDRCGFAEAIAPSDGPGTYRFVTTVRVVHVTAGISTERVTSNTFEVR